MGGLRAANTDNRYFITRPAGPPVAALTVNRLLPIVSPGIDLICLGGTVPHRDKFPMAKGVKKGWNWHFAGPY